MYLMEGLEQLPVLEESVCQERWVITCSRMAFGSF